MSVPHKNTPETESLTEDVATPEPKEQNEREQAKTDASLDVPKDTQQDTEELASQQQTTESSQCSDPGVEPDAQGGGKPPTLSHNDTFVPSPHPDENALEESETNATDKPMSLMDHLNELRRCLTKASIAVFICFIGCWVVVDPIFDTLVNPLLKVLPAGSHAIYTTLPEGFFTRMYIAFVGGVFLSSPVLFYQIWSFISPGLYDEEKRYIVPIAFLSAIFFMGGGLFCFFIVFPYAFAFFVSFATDEIVAMPKVSDYLNFVLKLLLAFGLIFEMPLFTFFLSRLGLITANAMRKVRRYAVLVIFIVAAILTPPDVVSQILMAGPMLVLYEVSILIAAFFGRKPKKKEEQESSEETNL